MFLWSVQCNRCNVFNLLKQQILVCHFPPLLTKMFTKKFLFNLYELYETQYGISPMPTILRGDSHTLDNMERQKIDTKILLALDKEQILSLYFLHFLYFREFEFAHSCFGVAKW